VEKTEHVIAAVRTMPQLKAAFASPLHCLFLLDANLLTIVALLKKAKELGKDIFVHIDLAQGIGKDVSGLQFLQRIGVKGIISTKSNMIRQAKAMGLETVQRLFVLDSQFLTSGMASLSGVTPDFIEIMPGVVAKAITAVVGSGIAPVIAGGLVETEEEVRIALSAGATAVSTGKISLWSMEGERQ